MLITISSANADIGGIGVGLRTCGQFAEDYQLAPRRIGDVYFAWAQGFLTGVNGIAIAKRDGTNRDLSSVAVEQQEQFLRDYCNDHPQAEYMQGVVVLYLKFKLSTPAIKN
jgi:hypothetical protein